MWLIEGKTGLKGVGDVVFGTILAAQNFPKVNLSYLTKFHQD